MSAVFRQLDATYGGGSCRFKISPILISLRLVSYILLDATALKAFPTCCRLVFRRFLCPLLVTNGINPVR